MVIRKLLGWAVIISLFLLTIIISSRRYQLKHNFLLANAIIEDVKIAFQKNGTWLVVYSFTSPEGMRVRHEGLYHIYYDRKDSLIGRTIPCAYYKKNYQRSELLVYKQTWKQYRLAYPDTLQWTRDFFKDILFSY